MLYYYGNGNYFVRILIDTLLLSFESVPWWLYCLMVAVPIVVVFAVAEKIYALRHDSELVRKVVHISTGHVILIAWWWDFPAGVGIGCSVVAACVALLSYRYPLLPGINSVGRRSLGTFFYAVSIGVLTAWFWEFDGRQYAAMGVLIMCWGDGLAALFGRRYGRHKYVVWGFEKSWEGSMMMFLVSWLVGGLILGFGGGGWLMVVGISLVVSIAATVLEAFSGWGVDNFTVPVGSAALAYFLSIMVGL